MQSRKMNTTLTKQSKRETACLARFAQQCYSGWQYWIKVVAVAGRSSNRSAANSLYRYPSPHRPAYSPSRPITVFRLNKTNLRNDIGYHRGIAIHRGADRTNCGASYKSMIGLRLCKRHQSSLRQWRYSDWRVVSTATWSVAWLAQAQASWARRYLGLTQLVQHWLVPQLAFCVTTQASAAHHVKFFAQVAKFNLFDRRRGFPSAAISCSGDAK